MYLSYWGLSRPPFRNGCDRDFRVDLDAQAAAALKLRLAAGSGGAAWLTGPPGLGKTHLARVLLDEFSGEGHLTAYLAWPQATPLDLLAAFAPGGGAAPRPGRSDFSVLRDWLAAASAAGRRALAAVDSLERGDGDSGLEMLAALAGAAPDGRQALDLLLVGTEAAHPRLERTGLLGRCPAIARLEPLGADCAREYLIARLRAAGMTRPVFTRRAAQRVAACSGGVPRDINRLADLALMAGFSLEAAKITPDLVDMAAMDLGLPVPAGEAAPGAEPLFEAPPEMDILAGLACRGAAAE